MLRDFKAFAMRGNVMDLAVGVIIGAAFGRIVSSLVDDMLMPLLGLVVGRVDFSNLFVTLGAGTFATVAEAKKAGVATLNYGLFLNSVVQFLIVAVAIFLLVKQLNRFQAPPPPAPAPATKDCPFCATAIPGAAKKCPHCTSAL